MPINLAYNNRNFVFILKFKSPFESFLFLRIRENVLIHTFLHSLTIHHSYINTYETRTNTHITHIRIQTHTHSAGVGPTPASIYIITLLHRIVDEIQ